MARILTEDQWNEVRAGLPGPEPLQVEDELIELINRIPSTFEFNSGEAFSPTEFFAWLFAWFLEVSEAAFGENAQEISLSLEEASRRITAYVSVGAGIIQNTSRLVMEKMREASDTRISS